METGKKSLVTKNQITGNISVTVDSLFSVKELITWLESRKKVNVTIVIQSVGNVANSHLENVNRLFM